MIAGVRSTRALIRGLTLILIILGTGAPGGCAATGAKATLESNLHSSDLSFRSQSCDITARLEWTL